MKNLSNFLSNERNNQVLSISDLSKVKGGNTPPSKPDDPFKTLPNGKAYGYWK